MMSTPPRKYAMVDVTCGSCGEKRTVRADNARRPGSNRCRSCASRETKRPQLEPVIEVTPEIEVWALIETAFWTDQDWRLIREGLFWDEKVTA